MSDRPHLAKKFRSRLLKQVIVISTTNVMGRIKSSLMKAVLGMTPALSDVSRLGKMRDIWPLMVFGGQRIAALLRNGVIVDTAALLLVALFWTSQAKFIWRSES
jgi:hypothetical protein